MYYYALYLQIIKSIGGNMEYTEITSRKNNLIIQASQLEDKKFRDKQKLFCAEGYKLLEEAINAKMKIERIFFTKSALDKYSALISASGCDKLYLVSEEVYNKLSSEQAPQGIVSSIKLPELCVPELCDIQAGGFIILDSVQNPQNLGAVIRCAYSLGVKKIVLTSGCADTFGPKAVRAAMGAVFKSQLFYVPEACQIAKALKECGLRTFCTCLERDSAKLGGFEFLPTDSIVIGNEGHGVSLQTRLSCTNTVFIPMVNGAESLNAATAAAITIWEMKKSSFFN